MIKVTIVFTDGDKEMVECQSTKYVDRGVWILRDDKNTFVPYYNTYTITEQEESEQ